MGTSAAQDKLIYEEKDVEFNVGLAKTKSKKYILIQSRQTLTTEYRYIDADNPAAEPESSRPVFAVTNITSITTPESSISIERQREELSLDDDAGQPTERANWQELIPHRPTHCWSTSKSLRISCW